MHPDLISFRRGKLWLMFSPINPHLSCGHPMTRSRPRARNPVRGGEETGKNQDERRGAFAPNYFNRAAISSPKIAASEIGRFASARFTMAGSRKETADIWMLPPETAA